jgi:hypothetical protein
MLFFTAFNRKSDSENIIDILLGYVSQEVYQEDTASEVCDLLVREVKKTVDFQDDPFTFNITYTDYPYS